MPVAQPSDPPADSAWHESELVPWTPEDRLVQFPLMADQLRRGVPALVILNECRAHVPRASGDSIPPIQPPRATAPLPQSGGQGRGGSQGT